MESCFFMRQEAKLEKEYGVAGVIPTSLAGSEAVLVRLEKPIDIEICGTGRSIQIEAGEKRLVATRHINYPWFMLSSTNYGLPTACWDILIQNKAVKILRVIN